MEEVGSKQLEGSLRHPDAATIVHKTRHACGCGWHTDGRCGQSVEFLA